MTSDERNALRARAIKYAEDGDYASQDLANDSIGIEMFHFAQGEIVAAVQAERERCIALIHRDLAPMTARAVEVNIRDISK